MEQSQQFLAILEALNAGAVRYVVIGGVAMRLHGSAHITDDVDICYGRDAANLQALAAALAPYHPSLRGAPPGLPFVLDARTLKASLNFPLATDVGAVDILGEAAGITSFDGLWERSVVMDVHNQSLQVASLDDLIAMKRAAGRVKDQNHLLELEALRALVRDEGQQN
ncbi:MAG: hypothetical protein M3Y28_03405 [Armatimonadota bacterium]|nr:hypothetical protein [Armatimonadota bacterium]